MLLRDPYRRHTIRILVLDVHKSLRDCYEEDLAILHVYGKAQHHTLRINNNNNTTSVHILLENCTVRLCDQMRIFASSWCFLRFTLFLSLSLALEKSHSRFYNLRRSLYVRAVHTMRQVLFRCGSIPLLAAIAATGC